MAFDLKLTPKDKEEITKFVNFVMQENAKYDFYNGKIVYINALNPGKHIYKAYYMDNGTGKPLSYAPGSDVYKKEFPLFTLQDLHYDDIIIFNTLEDVRKREEQDKLKIKKP